MTVLTPPPRPGSAGRLAEGVAIGAQLIGNASDGLADIFGVALLVQSIQATATAPDRRDDEIFVNSSFG